MSREPDIDLARLQIPADILATKAVSHAPDTLAAQVVAHLIQDSVDDRLRLGWHVVLHPVHDVEAFRAIDWHRITVEEVGDYDEVPFRGELVGE